MTIAEKKIELVQNLLLLRDNSVLFEIENLLSRAFKIQDGHEKMRVAQEKKLPATFEAWATQFEDPENPDELDEFGMTTTQFRQRMWAAEQSPEMSLEEFFEQVSKN